MLFRNDDAGRSTVELLERHGDFLLAQGFPQLARRSWRLCEELGPLPGSVREKREQLDSGEQAGR